MSEPIATLGPVSALQAQGMARPAPDWVHLLPTGIIETADGRGPFRLGDAAAVIAASMDMAGGKIVIDENHATDLAAPQGGPSPARGWIVALEARADGIWGRVEWTPAGEALIADGAYRGISPVLLHKRDGTVIAVLRAALTNTPNLRGLTALHSREKTSMDDLLPKLRTILGLKDGADQAVVLNAITALAATADLLPQMRNALGLGETADAAATIAAARQLRGWNGMRTALMSIARHAGLKEDADAQSIVAAVESLAVSAKAGAAGTDAVKSLQAELAAVGGELAALKTDRARERATAFVDAEIAKGRVGVKPLREHYIARHMTDAAGVEKEIGALPVLSGAGALLPPTPETKDGKIALSAEQQAAARMLGLKPDDYAKTLAAEAASQEVSR